MKYTIPIISALSLIIPAIYSCEENPSSSKSDNIVYGSINKEYVLIRDVKTLKESDDAISDHVDSIISGLIDEEFISTGLKSYDLNKDSIPDVSFEIIDLNKFNQNKLPESFDSLAARVQPLSVQILDNSTYGYPDALNLNDRISENGNWSSQISVLGTFMNAGQFQGKGEKYLGIRIIKNQSFNYGWIKLYCSLHNDTLRIVEFAYNQSEGNTINAGQKE